MSYYHICYDEMVGFDNWLERWETNLNYTSLVEWLKKYKEGELIYCILNEIYETDSQIRGIQEAKQARNITKLLNWSSEIPERKRAKTNPRKVFIVHGREDKPAYELAWVLEKDMGLIPIILREKTDEGRTIIEKLEKHSDVRYAFIILTPDDIGALSAEREKLKPRARQNVILELGYFLGKLGRKNVCCLLKGDIELPSDVSGIVYKQFKESVRECIFDIVKELIVAGSSLKIFSKDTARINGIE